MTRISQADQVLLLLREKLQRMDRARAGQASRSGRAREAASNPLARLHAMASLDQLSDEDFKRTMVRALLAEELGDGIANDPVFQSVVDDVVRMIGENDEGRDLIERAARQLRTEN